MSKREIRRRLAASVRARADNQQYHKDSRIDDLYEAAAKKKRTHDRRRRQFTTTFPIPKSAVASARRRNAGQTQLKHTHATQGSLNMDSISKHDISQNMQKHNGTDRGTKPTKNPVCLDLDHNMITPLLFRERFEILLIAVCVTYSIVLETGEDLGYWGKKLSFAFAVAALFVVHRLDHGSTAYILDPAPWRGGFRFALSFGWALFCFGVANKLTSSHYTFLFRTGVAVVAFVARHEALPRLVHAAQRWWRAKRGEF